ncbi:MAG: polymer-forming cytoskeletal protein [Anaerolineales bacterium]|jgi:hypothetical protein|nr:polymer-forming cytoskeletal protein [Anaerolineales bacterium]
MRTAKSLFVMAAFLLMLAAAFPLPVQAAEPGLVVLGSTYTLSSGETLEDDLTILGGHALIEEGATVEGDIFLLGGTLRIAGKVKGDISAAGGVLDLEAPAQITGNITVAGASISRADGSVVEGQIISGSSDSFNNLRANNLHLPFVADQVLSPLAFLFRSLAAAALAVLVVMFFQKPVERVAQAGISQPLLSGGMGLLTIAVFPLAFILVIITILLIPVGLFGILALAVAYLFGWIALGYEAGRRITAMFHWDWAAPIIAGMGTLVVSLVFGGLGQIPCLGWLISFLVWNVGLGAVILTRFGLQDYVRDLPSGSPNPKA